MDVDDRKYMVCPQKKESSVSRNGGIRIYRTYSERWYVLLAVCLLALSNATIWISFAPLHDATTKFYCDPKDISHCEVTYWSSQIFQIVGVVTGIFGIYITDIYGIRVACVCGASFNFFGAFVRTVSSIPALPTFFRLPIFYTGQISFFETLAACSQPFFLVSSSKVAEFWFSENQRTLANALSFIANPLGVVFGSIAPVIFVSNSKSTHHSNDILILNSALLILAAVVLVISLGVRRSKPLSPPSASSECANSPPFVQGLCRLLRTPIFYVQMATFGFAFALQWSFFITADKMLGQLGYKDKVTSYIMSLSAISGCVASILIGIFVDRTKRFKEVIKTCYICMAITAVAINLFLRNQKSRLADDFILIGLLVLLGFFSIPVFPISLELGVETTFPIAEATSSGVLIIAGQLMMFSVTFAMEGLESSYLGYETQHRYANNHTSMDRPKNFDQLFAENYQLSIDFWTIAAIFAAVFAYTFLWPRYQRLEFEERTTYIQRSDSEKRRCNEPTAV